MPLIAWYILYQQASGNQPGDGFFAFIYYAANTDDYLLVITVLCIVVAKFPLKRWKAVAECHLIRLSVEPSRFE
jgi:hypothetical protein